MFSIYVFTNAELPTNIVVDSSRERVRMYRPQKARAPILANFLNLKLYYFYVEIAYDVSKADMPILLTASNTISVLVIAQL